MTHVVRVSPSVFAPLRKSCNGERGGVSMKTGFRTRGRLRDGLPNVGRPAHRGASTRSSEGPICGEVGRPRPGSASFPIV